MGVDSIDDIPSMERRRQQKKKERLEAHHRLMWLATLRQRQAQMIPVVEQHLLAALGLGRSARGAMRGALPPPGQPMRARASLLDQAGEREQVQIKRKQDQIGRENEQIERAQSESQTHARERHQEQTPVIRASIKGQRAIDTGGTDAAYQRARQMLDALLPASGLHKGNAAPGEAARSVQPTHQRKAEAKSATRRTVEQSHGAVEPSSARRIADEARQGNQEHKQQVARDLQSTRGGVDQAIERSRADDRRPADAIQTDTADQNHRNRARDAAKQTTKDRLAEEEKSRIPHWLERLRRLDTDTVRKEEIDRLRADIEAAQQLARKAHSREQGQDRTTHASNLIKKPDPLAPRELKRALAQLRTQAEKNPALAPLADELLHVLKMARRAERASRKRDENLARESGRKPADDDAGWMRRIDQMAQALSGVLGPDVQTKALQSLLGPDVARLARLMTHGAVPALLETQQLRLKRRALKLERWALKEHSTKLAEELRDWLNRERRRIEQAENPSAAGAAGSGAVQHGAADNAFLKQVQSL